MRYMDQQFVCPQCGEESDIQGPCPMCGLPMVSIRDESEDSLGSSFDEEPYSEKTGEDEEEDVVYNPYEE